jgi:putative peptidoglycan lipid II flippase
MTLVSRILGFVRDAVIARMFGAGLATDAFFVAFRIPNLLRRLFAEGAFSQAFVPILAHHRSQHGGELSHALVSRTASLLTVALFVVTLVGIAAAPLIIYVTAPGFSENAEKFELTVSLLRVTFPYILFISLVSLAGGVLNTWSRFSVPAFTPTLLNVAFIVGALFFAPYFDPPVKVLAWSVFAGGILQLAFQIPALVRIGMLPRWELAPRDPDVRRVLALMGPAVVGVSVGQISLLLNTIFASFLETGSVSWLYYADRLMEFPTGLLGAALGTILLPSLARAHARDAREEYSALLDWGLRLTLLLAVPSAVALGVLATPLIATLFMHGAFDVRDMVQTRSALIAYSVGLVGLILVKVLAPGFYARQNIRTPVKIAIVTLGATQLMNAAFIVPLRHAGLALAIGLGACLNAAILYRSLRRQAVFQPRPGWTRFGARLLLAVAAMAVVLWFAAGPAPWWVAAGWQARLLRLLGVIVGGATVYFASLYLLGFRLRDFHRRGSAE